jgi:hypothetical protein
MMTWPRITCIWLTAALAATLATAPSTAAAAARKTDGTAVLPGLALTWNDCAGGASLANMSYGCNGATDTLTLYCALAVPTAVSNVIGAEVVVDIQHASAALPDWWQLSGGGTAGCRAGVLSTSFDFTLNAGCTDAWQTFGFGGIQGFTVGSPDHTFPNQARIKAVAAVTSDHAASLTPGIEYGVLKLRLASGRTIGANVCAGCGEAACLVFQSAILRVIPGTGSDMSLPDPATPGADFATWQGTAADCSVVPVRHSSWGQIKSLYR